MRLIDGDVFKAKVRSKITWLLERGMKVDGKWIWAMVNEILEDATIESEKSEQIGHWVNGRRCSICGNFWDDYISGDIWYDGDPQFCPHCGARMEADILNYFKDIDSYYNDCTRYDTLKRMLEDIVAETKEDAERKKGEWEMVSQHENPPTYIYRCSECRHKSFGFYNYCPNCGAEMTEDSECQST